MRQTQGSVVCSQCGRLVGVNEEKCPFCGAWRPGLFGWATVLRRALGGRLDLFTIIGGACAILYVVALLVSVVSGENILGGGLFSILSPSFVALAKLGMTGELRLTNGEVLNAWGMQWWWTPLTAIYLHGSLLHIGFNVYWIRILGPAATEVYGPGRTFLLFNIAGAGGFLVSNVMTSVLGGYSVPTMGASGSIFGLLAALIVYGRRRGSSMVTQQLWQYAIFMGVLGFVMPNVNNWAHGGGFAAGWIGAQLMSLDDDRQDSSWVMLTSLGLIVLTLAGVVLSFWRVTDILLS